MRAHLDPELIDAVYRTVTEPDGWHEVCEIAARLWPSRAQTFYILDRRTRRVRPGALIGVGEQWVAAFDEMYFSPDNPWFRYSDRLHRPAGVRTNERLAALLQDHDALYRSAYYNEWMRPQGFRWTIGTTMVADDRMVANFTLLREPDRPTFDEVEVAAFGRVAAHMTRALELGVRLESAQAASGAAALDAIRSPVALVDARLAVAYANEAMQALLRRGTGLRSRHGRLVATDAESHRALAASVAGALSAAAAAPSDDGLVGIRCAPDRMLAVRAAPARGALGRYLPSPPLALLVFADPAREPPVRAEAVRRLYGCTNAEARLVAALVAGASLQRAAGTLGVRYETARSTLKSAFGKLGVDSQARLVARVLRDLPP